MRMIVPVQMTDTRLIFSSIPENDATPWATGTPYALGAIVMHEHRVWEALRAVAADVEPTDGAVQDWLPLRATIRWAPFDGFEDTVASATDSIQYDFRVDDLAHSVAVLRQTAEEVRLRVYDESDVLLYDQTERGVSGANVAGWYDYFFEPILPQSEVIFTPDVSIQSGYRIRLNFTGVGTVSVGTIAYGRDYLIGETLIDSRVGFRNFSLRDYDDFGIRRVTPRRRVREATYRVASLPNQTGRNLQLLMDRAGEGAVFYPSAGLDIYALTIFGLPEDPEIPTQIGRNIHEIVIKGDA